MREESEISTILEAIKRITSMQVQELLEEAAEWASDGDTDRVAHLAREALDRLQLTKCLILGILSESQSDWMMDEILECRELETHLASLFNSTLSVALSIKITSRFHIEA
jgi:hypothetical protein